MMKTIERTIRIIAGLWLVWRATAVSDVECGVIDMGESLSKHYKQRPSSDTLKEMVQITPRISGGVDTQRREFPYIVKSATENGLICAGTLIHRDIVLTAAHCQGSFVDGVIVSAYELDSTVNENEIHRHVDRQYRHPGYNAEIDVVEHDLMILRLSEPVHDVFPVTLNANPYVPSENEPDEKLLAIGYGLKSLTGELPAVLQKVELSYLPPRFCDPILEEGANVDAGGGILCAATDSAEDRDKSVCAGDSGGPLLASSGVQVGITSFGVDCTSNPLPNGFTRVSHYFDWIQEQICKRSRSPPNYCHRPDLHMDPHMAMVNITIQHDKMAGETTWAVRDRTTQDVVSVGPVGNPLPFSKWWSVVRLEPGEYTFELYDQMGDGMVDVVAGWVEIRVQMGNEQVMVADRQYGFFEAMQTTEFDVPEPPTDAPTPSPSAHPTGSPTTAPTFAPPTRQPTGSPTTSPTRFPTFSPSSRPTASPSVAPTGGPTTSPSASPSSTPTISPAPSLNPTAVPTRSPAPSSWPTISPPPTTSPAPTSRFHWAHHIPKPTAAPTHSPPTNSPAPSISPAPSDKPSPSPSASPIQTSTRSPTRQPTKSPTGAPHTAPSSSPTAQPTTTPTQNPTRRPTRAPSPAPSRTPSAGPTSPAPSTVPTGSPQPSTTHMPTLRFHWAHHLPPDAPTAAPTLRFHWAHQLPPPVPNDMVGLAAATTTRQKSRSYQLVDDGNGDKSSSSSSSSSRRRSSLGLVVVVAVSSLWIVVVTML